MSECFLCLISTKQRIKCLAQGHSTVPYVNLSFSMTNFPLLIKISKSKTDSVPGKLISMDCNKGVMGSIPVRPHEML